MKILLASKLRTVSSKGVYLRVTAAIPESNAVLWKRVK